MFSHIPYEVGERFGKKPANRGSESGGVKKRMLGQASSNTPPTMPMTSQRKTKSRILETTHTKQELENYVNHQVSTILKDIVLGSPGHVPWPQKSTTPFDTSQLKWAEVGQGLQQHLDTSTFLTSPRFLKHIWRPISTAWKIQAIPAEWHRAITTFFLKEKGSHVQSC